MTKTTSEIFQNDTKYNELRDNMLSTFNKYFIDDFSYEAVANRIKSKKAVAELKAYVETNKV